MDNLRFKALEISLQRQSKEFTLPKEKASTYFGELTFNKSAMKEYLTPEAFKQVMNSIETGEKIIAVSIYNLNSAMILLKRVLDNNFIDISHLEQGVYLVKILTENGIIMKKLIKK